MGAGKPALFMKGMYEFFRQKSIIGKSTLPPAGRRRMHVLPYRPPAFRKTGKAGPVPFAPAEIEKRLAPEEILADTKSIAVILFPYRYPEEKNANIALYARAKDYHHVVRAYLAKLSDIWKSSIPMKNSMRLPIHPPWQTAGSLTRQDSVFRQEPLPHTSEVRFLLYHRSHTDHFGTSSGHPACNELRQLHPLFRGMPRKSAFPRTVQSVAMQIVPHAKERSLK